MNDLPQWGVVMRSLLSGIRLFLAFLSTHVQAAAGETSGSPPSDTVGVIWVLVFVVIFFGMIGYFTWSLISSERKRKLKDKQPE
ncbi:MAG: hypothetical protein FJY54_03205 [Betaproteobacteria bacterium]|nr:hypothetical protein [Betaproteobacteria bacterium]